LQKQKQLSTPDVPPEKTRPHFANDEFRELAIAILCSQPLILWPLDFPNCGPGSRQKKRRKAKTEIKLWGRPEPGLAENHLRRAGKKRRSRPAGTATKYKS
jgi:hypothetical protein